MNKIVFNYLLNKTTEYYSLSKELLFTKNRKREVVYCRTAVYMIGREMGFSLNKLGLLFNQDHSNVLHHIDKGTEMLNNPTSIDFKDFYKKVYSAYCRDFKKKRKDKLSDALMFSRLDSMVTQEHVAYKSKLHISTIKKIESGKRGLSISTLIKILSSIECNLIIESRNNYYYINEI
jgi:hypothetical protein